LPLSYHGYLRLVPARAVPQPQRAEERSTLKWVVLEPRSVVRERKRLSHLQDRLRDGRCESIGNPCLTRVDLSYARGVVSGSASPSPTPWSPWTVCAASSISSAAALGWEIIDGCDARTSTMCALARWAMKSCSNGGITLSSVPSKYQDGIVFQAGVRDFSPVLH